MLRTWGTVHISGQKRNRGSKLLSGGEGGKSYTDNEESGREKRTKVFVQ